MAEIYGMHESEHLKNSPPSSLKNLCRRVIQRTFHQKTTLSKECAALPLPPGLKKYLSFVPGYTPGNRSAKAYIERYFAATDTSGLLVYLFLNKQDRVICMWPAVVENPSDFVKKNTAHFVIKKALALRAYSVQFYYRPKECDPACAGDTVAKYLQRNDRFYDNTRDFDNLNRINGVTLWKSMVWHG
ncbi:hypothetical protein [Endozoicomonas sp. YOMI1]|uniref:hypothetical protein n=1 Tax=Endozoicomonas sp. YOMI1 TaxID=2828739 RepID=UPI0021495F45|nr:hypothetical protein [Endozoicomonas sp. YOMI1]